MNVVQAAKAQVAAESAAAQRGTHFSPAQKKRGPQLVDGELQWIGEYSDPRETKPFRMVNGDKQELTPAEQKLFARTPYERGYAEYNYEGTVRVVRPGHDPKDPRYSYREGHGTLKYPAGELYEGQWKLNRRHGDGYLSLPTGYRYQGEWAEDRMHGKGYETFLARTALDATFEAGVPSGQGVMLFAQGGGYRYEGEFANGKRHGRGTVFYDNGDVFQGTWDQGQRHGRGVTTTRTRGKELQYESEWEQGQLVEAPSCIQKSKRTRRPNAELQFSTQGLAPADLTKWKVKNDVTELPMEHFMRIKLGFEKLDDNGSGSLSSVELAHLWGDGSQEMLRKLDADNNGTVELDEIFGAWYPNVPPHNVLRFMTLDINPRQLLRQRGHLCGVSDDSSNGYYYVISVRDPEASEDPKPLALKQLQTAGYKIGGEKFTVANYETARTLCDPPYFLEVLEAWYPNVPRTTLQRYEMTDIPAAELEAFQRQFYVLSNGEVELAIDQFEEAQERWRAREPQAGNPVDATMMDGFFKGQPFWPVGALRISVQLLKDVDAFDKKNVGGVTMQQLLRYCYPSIRCKRTQEHLLNRRKVGVAACTCQICALS